MIVNRLRASQLKSLPDGRHLDGNGLYLRVVGNSRTWMLRFRFNGKRHDIGLGPLSLAEAREKAAALHRDIAEGKHPLVVREVQNALKAKEAVKAKGLTTTLEDVYIEALEFHYEVNSLRSARWLKETTSLLKRRILPQIGQTPLIALTPQAIADALRPTWTSTWGQRALTGIRACFNYATAKGLFVGESPARWEGALALHLPKSSKALVVTHIPSCPWQDVPKLWQELDALPDSQKKRIVQATILCVTRPNELRALKTSEVNTAKRFITILVSKTSTEPWDIPYSSQVSELFDFTGDWPFGGTISGTELSRYFKKHFPAYKLHGFRSSFSSWCADHEKNPETREACLHHSLGGRVTLAYQRSNLLELRRELLQEWADYVTGREPPASA